MTTQTCRIVFMAAVTPAKEKKEVTVHARIIPGLYQKVIRQAHAEHRTVSAMVAELIRRGTEIGVKW